MAYALRFNADFSNRDQYTILRYLLHWQQCMSSLSSDLTCSSCWIYQDLQAFLSSYPVFSEVNWLSQTRPLSLYITLYTDTNNSSKSNHSKLLHQKGVSELPCVYILLHEQNGIFNSKCVDFLLIRNINLHAFTLGTYIFY